jgi:hypothetical protein
LALGGAAFFVEKEAKAKGQMPWQPRQLYLPVPGDPPVPMHTAVYVALYNSATGEARIVLATIVGQPGTPGGPYTLLMGKADGVQPYGYEEGKMVELARDFFAIAR